MKNMKKYYLFQASATCSYQSGDDRWYEDSSEIDQVRDSPPPLPMRLQQLNKQKKENSEVMILAKKWEDRNLKDLSGEKVQKNWSGQGKKWTHESDSSHTKIQSSNSFPLTYASFTAPVASLSTAVK